MVISQSFLNIGHLQSREKLLNVIKQILNHASIQTTMRYAHTMREQEISAVETFANFN